MFDSGTEFNDASLDDPLTLQKADQTLRYLASSGARVRSVSSQKRQSVVDQIFDQPRAIIAAGNEVRLIRALLEPVCPVPFIAWAMPGLPGWVGSLDLVVVSAADGGDEALISTLHEATRRGARVLLVSPNSSQITQFVPSRDSIHIDIETSDDLAASIVILSVLHEAGLGPAMEIEAISAVLDTIAKTSSPFQEAVTNPAKQLASSVSKSQALLWGGSVLAARASRRVAEAIRAAQGQAALAADAEELLTVLSAVRPKDVFADPVEEHQTPRPILMIFDDGKNDPLVQQKHKMLVDTAERNDIRIELIKATHGSDIERYVQLLQAGRYAAVYLGIGLGSYRYVPDQEGS